MTIDEAIVAAAERYNLDPNLLRAVALQESRNNPRAVSRAGAQGLFQLMPGTAAELGVQDPFDPVQSAMGGAKYLARNIARFGDVDQGLAAYNAGPGNVRRYKGIPPFPETQNYVRRVNAFRSSFDADPVIYSAGQREVPSRGRSSMAFVDPLTEAIDAMPSVTPSKTTESDAALTSKTVDKLISGLPAENWTGSLNHPTDRLNNSTGAVAAEQIPAWQSALGVLNPLNLLQLPVRALRMVDYTLRTAAGSPTLTDQANSALDYVDSVYNRADLGDAGTTQDALAAGRDRTAGIRAQMGGLPERWVKVLTQDPFEADRQALNAAKSLRARLQGVQDYADANRARTQEVLSSQMAPLQLDEAKSDQERRKFEMDRMRRRAPWEERRLEADTLRSEYELENAPIDDEARRGYMQGQIDRMYGGDPTEAGKTERQRIIDQRLRDKDAEKSGQFWAAENRRWAEQHQRTEQAAAKALENATSEEEAKAILGRFPSLEGYSVQGLGGTTILGRQILGHKKFVLVPPRKASSDAGRSFSGTAPRRVDDGFMDSVVGDNVPSYGNPSPAFMDSVSSPSPPTPTPTPSPNTQGSTNYDAEMGRAMQVARRALLREGITSPTDSQLREKATELLHRASGR